MGGFIEPPRRIPLLLQFGIWVSRKATGRDLLIARLLAWYPKAALGSAMMESLVAHHDKTISERMLKLVRIQASYSASCPFCIDMNSFEYGKHGITSPEYAAMRDEADLSDIESMTAREKLAVEYARLISRSPLDFPVEFIHSLRGAFNEREIIILASTGAQVNYWARLGSALGVPPAGFTETCRIEPDDKVT